MKSSTEQLTTSDNQLTHVSVLLLHKLEESSHVWSTKVVNGPKASEHALPAQALEVVLADVLKQSRNDGIQRAILSFFFRKKYN
jgi:hypothetical protein